MVLNLDKTNLIEFIKHNLLRSVLCTGYKEKHVDEKLNQNSLVYKLITTYMRRVNQADKLITKSNGVYYAVRLVAHNSNTTTLKFISHFTLQSNME